MARSQGRKELASAIGRKGGKARRVSSRLLAGRRPAAPPGPGAPLPGRPRGLAPARPVLPAR
eukprot:14830472-Alexandrium_andersonii.AAC.1